MSQSPITPSPSAQDPESLRPLGDGGDGGSKIPPPPADALTAIQGTVERLRAELAGTNDKARQARLLGEIGELEERAGDEPGAARDYLAAFNAEPGFREPLEGLVRLLERRRSLKNLGRLVDALARAAQNPDEKARALLMKAAYLEDVVSDVGGAKTAARDATLAEAPRAETASAWLAVELLAAKQSDTVLREEALTERAKYSANETWRGLVLLDVARLATDAGDVDRALAVLAEAGALGAGATYLAALAVERLARKEAGLAGSDEARARADAHARALESQATLLHEAVTSEGRGDALGVPRWARSATMMADAWLRAAEARHAIGELGRAATILDHAREVMAKAAADGVVVPPLVEAALGNARIRIAELMGDTELSATLAEQRLSKEQDGGVAAALAMRIAEHAASQGDGVRALEALSRAIASDPSCIPARALQLDLLADRGDTTTFAAQLESFADHLATDEARGRAFVLAAYVWAVRAGDAAGAKAALSQAAMFGVPPGTVARLARTMASLDGDLAWYEEATKRLLSSGASEGEVVPLWVELVRARFARGDAEGATKAMRELGASPKGAWLGRVLEAFLPEKFDPERTTAKGEERRHIALDELSGIEQDADIARGLALLAAMRAHAGGDVEGTRRRLAELVRTDPSDALVPSYLAELERAAGDHGAAADAAAASAEATSDIELATALHLEAGFERWKHGDRKAAIEAFERAASDSSGASDAPKIVLAWASRALDVDVVGGRRKALDRALDGGGDARLVALERFATEVGGGDAADASAALGVLDRDAAEGSDLAIAGALARMSWSHGAAEVDARLAAAARIAALGPEAAAFAAAEEARVARESGDVEDTARAARAWFAAGGGLVAALEWCAAAMALGHPAEERDARRAVARILQGDAREAMAASSALVDGPRDYDGGDGAPLPFIPGESAAAHLANLELAPPGCDPRRRATALVEIDAALGDEGREDALALAAWSALAAGDTRAAIVAWERVVVTRPRDLAAWEGLRTCGETIGDKALRARAAAELGVLCSDPPRGGAFSEEAALLWLELGEGARAETALAAGFERDPTRHVAFDKLFRLVRERVEPDKLLAIIHKRLEVTDEPQEIAKLFWEQARALRQKGDQDGALKALEHVTMLEPDHVGALALTGEIALKRGLYDEAATALARLATLTTAPAKNRVTAGVAAVDIFENKLDRFDRALEVLLGLHRAKLSSLPVRERLARAAARTGSWHEATAILEELMHERPEAEGRIEAARLAMAIHRDRLNDPAAARPAIVKLLEESATDGEGIDMLLATEHPPALREKLLLNARVQLLATLGSRPTDAPSVRRLVKVARALGDDAMLQAALSVAVALGGDATSEQQLAAMAAKKPRAPTIAITPSLFRAILAPGDEGPVAALFTALGPTLAEALGPSLQACGVTKKDKIDPRSGLALRNEITAWTGAFGIPQFDLYVGGRDPLGVQGVPGETPSLVVGSGVNAPLSPMTRARVARELLAMVRGTTVVRVRDDISVAAVVVAACRIAEVRVEHPPYAVLAEIEKLVSKAIARKTKKFLPDLCRAVVSSNSDARAWAKRALMSQARIAVIACGDVGLVLPDALSEAMDKVPAAVRGDARAEELLRFVLSPAYLELRRSFGLEGAS